VKYIEVNEEKRTIGLTKEGEKILAKIRDEIKSTPRPALALYSVIDQLAEGLTVADVALACEVAKHNALTTFHIESHLDAMLKERLKEVSKRA